jgi:hypothetical protein
MGMASSGKLGCVSLTLRDWAKRHLLFPYVGKKFLTSVAQTEGAISGRLQGLQLAKTLLYDPNILLKSAI